MAKEIERAGIPTALITTLVSLAENVGANRIVQGVAVAHPLGDPARSPAEEQQLRLGLVRQALARLGEPLTAAQPA